MCQREVLGAVLVVVVEVLTTDRLETSGTAHVTQLRAKRPSSLGPLSQRRSPHCLPAAASLARRRGTEIGLEKGGGEMLSKM